MKTLACETCGQVIEEALEDEVIEKAWKHIQKEHPEQVRGASPSKQQAMKNALHKQVRDSSPSEEEPTTVNAEEDNGDSDEM
jgi:transcription initiation factor TFIIIB Brf1 subunit/transcription initiation factor TFIIB